jgi:hypothetical protein
MKDATNDNDTWQTLAAATARLLSKDKRFDDGGNHTKRDSEQSKSENRRDVA